MKQIGMLVLAATVMLNSGIQIYAMDFSAKGRFETTFHLGDNATFSGRVPGWNRKQDNFEVVQRLRMQLGAAALENLSGGLLLEIGDTFWGQRKTGGQLATTAKNVEVIRAYVDWFVPETPLKFRMGLQQVALPGFMLKNPLINADMAAVAASCTFNETAGLTAFWARPFNDNFAGSEDGREERLRPVLEESGAEAMKPVATGTAEAPGTLDNADLFGLSLPLRFTGLNVTPWAFYGVLGKYSPFIRAHRPEHVSPGERKSLRGYSDMISAGVTAELVAYAPFRFAFDGIYQHMETGVDRLDVEAWAVSSLAEYRADWGRPGVQFWYASGNRGGEDAPRGQFTGFAAYSNPQGIALYGGAGRRRYALIGYSISGTWALGGFIKDISFAGGLRHDLRLNYIGGTNDESSVAGRPAGWYYANLAPSEYAVEAGIRSKYDVYDGLNMTLDLAYLTLNLDGNLKKDGVKTGRGIKDYADAWNITLAFRYRF